MVERGYRMRGKAAGMKETQLLPSRFQLGDIVRVGSLHAMRPVTGICFRDSKVSYEVGGQFFDSEHVNEPLRSVKSLT